MALDFIGGCIGGCAGVVVGHPLDTVKIHLQTQTAGPTSTLACLRALVVKEGMRGLFRGMSSPLASVAAINAIVFGIYGNAQKHLPMDSLASHFCAGAAAGLLQSFICSPMELAKSRAQVASVPIKPLQCLRRIYQKRGVRGIFKGLNATILREVPGFGTYFLTYELMTRSERNGPVSTAWMLMAGGMAGIASWVVIYPVDLVKSRVQLDEGAYRGAMDCFRKSLAADGWRGMYRGMSTTVVRAFPVNAATFTVVAWSMRAMEEQRIWPSLAGTVIALKVSEHA